MKVKNISLKQIDLGGGAIPYAMVVCDVVLDNSQVVEDVAENIATTGFDIDWIDSNVIHNEDRLTDEQKEEVMQALSDWYKDLVSALDNYCYYMNSEYDKDLNWCFINGILRINEHEICPSKLEEIKNTSGSDYFNIELD